MILISVDVAQGEDLDRVARLYKNAGYGGGVSIDDVTIVAKTENRLVGVVRLCSEENFKVLRGMHVHPDFQRQGVGRNMLFRCESYLEQSDAYCLPYTHLTRLYEMIHFVVAAPEELPSLLSQRLHGYISSGQPVLAMKRAASKFGLAQIPDPKVE